MQPTSITTAMQRTSITTTAMQPISITTAMQRTSITTATATTSSDNFAAATWNAATVQQQQQQQHHHHHVLVPHFATEDTKNVEKAKKERKSWRISFDNDWHSFAKQSTSSVWHDSAIRCILQKIKRSLKSKERHFIAFLIPPYLGGGSSPSYPTIWVRIPPKSTVYIM